MAKRKRQKWTPYDVARVALQRYAKQEGIIGKSGQLKNLGSISRAFGIKFPSKQDVINFAATHPKVKFSDLNPKATAFDHAEFERAIKALEDYAKSQGIIGDLDELLTVSDVRLAFAKPIYMAEDVISFASLNKDVQFRRSHYSCSVDPEVKRKNEIVRIVYKNSRSKNQNTNLIKQAKTFEQRKAEALSKHNAKQATV